MKPFFLSILLVAFACSAQFAVAQNVEQPTVAQNNSPIFEIFVGNAEAPVRWYLEANAVSNEYGESVFRVEGDARTLLLSRIRDLENDPRVSDFELTAERNQLKIDMPDKSRDAVVRELEAILRQ